MSGRPLWPADAAEALAHHLEKSWAERSCTELAGAAEQPFAVPCDAAIATAGPVAIRRIEQERVDIADALRAMHRLRERHPRPREGSIYSSI